MSIVSFYFLLFLFISVAVYYVFPKKYRWIVLLISSILFFLISCSYRMLYYLFFGIITTYIGTRLITEKFNDNKKYKKATFIITLILIISELFALKYINIFPISANAFGRIFNINFSFGTLSLLAPLGISYYTLSLIGYVVDVYWGTYGAQKNFFKHCLFSCYYPMMISGPVIRYSQMKDELFNEKKLDFNNIYQGFTRIIYGLMKKLVIADLLAQIVSTIFTSYLYYRGICYVFGVICYAIQIYCDFSGCMDIVIGASKMYNVKLPENFESPFFSKSLPEFWRRWHITLGTWSKDYIMYPLLKSNLFQKFGKFSKNKLGKKYGKKVPTILAILILWLLIGIWHGVQFRYIFAAGILPWLYLTIGELCQGIPEKLNKLFHIKTDCFSFKLFQSIRTFLLMCLIWIFVCAPSFSQSPIILKRLFVFAEPSMLCELPKLPKLIIILMLILVTIVDYLKYNRVNVLEKFQNQNIIFRWIVLFALIIIILLYGSYGPAYNSVDFIYGGF